MNVTIEQRKFTLRSEYDITTPDSKFHAEKKLFSLTDRLRLQTEDGRVVARIKGYFSLFRPKYDFDFLDGNLYRFRCESLWKGVFSCENGRDRFRLYQHKGRNFSVFQNEIQIAAFTKNRVTIGKGDRYGIRMNDDANILVIICLALTVDVSENDGDNSGSTVSIDLGNIGPEARPFDASWEPNKKATARALHSTT